MFMEYLRFRVRPEQAGAFLAHNRRWLDALRRRPGFLAQRTFRHDTDPDVWLVLVEWRDKAALVAFPDELQRELDRVGNVVSTLERADNYREDEA